MVQHQVLRLGDEYKRLFIEDDNQVFSVRYDKRKEEWVSGGTALWDARVGFDDSEEEGSPFRYGNGACMEDIEEISKEEAEAFIGKAIDEQYIAKLLDIRKIK